MPTWVYGEIKCTTTHIATWVYGATLCTTIPSIAYPTLAWVRVTSLIHRFQPGIYTLTMGLGDLTADFVMPSMIAKPISALQPPPGPGPIEGCMWEGKLYSEGAIRQATGSFQQLICHNGKWELYPTPPAPETRCLWEGRWYNTGDIRTDKNGMRWQCDNGKWKYYPWIR